MVIPSHLSLKNFKSGTVLFATNYYDEAEKDAIDFCKENELTPEDVRVVKTRKDNSENYEMVLVIRK